MAKLVADPVVTIQRGLHEFSLGYRYLASGDVVFTTTYYNYYVTFYRKFKLDEYKDILFHLEQWMASYTDGNLQWISLDEIKLVMDLVISLYLRDDN